MTLRTTAMETVWRKSRWRIAPPITPNAGHTRLTYTTHSFMYVAVR